MQNPTLQTTILGGGCFWCTEAIFTRLKGIKTITPGYSGGNGENPTYDQVTTGTTNFAESIKIEFNPNEISFETILKVFFATHDPTTLNKQGADTGTQYRSVIFYMDEEQKQIAEKLIKEEMESGEIDGQIVTTLEKFDKFYDAEEYHYRYYDNNPSNAYCSIVISPKVKKLFEKFPELVKSSL
jgi:peptide-methionine (S)-S-oxide reductase